jgi:hypothetical protein
MLTMLICVAGLILVIASMIPRHAAIETTRDQVGRLMDVNGFADVTADLVNAAR